MIQTMLMMRLSYQRRYFVCKRSIITASEKLTALRAEMVADKLDALLVPSGDPHMSEYIADCFDYKQFISGFTGSAGIALITGSNAYMWTDGRYHIQAENEMDMSKWNLMKEGLPHVPSCPSYISTLPKGTRVGFDPHLHSAQTILQLTEKLVPRGVCMIPTSDNLVGRVWQTFGSRPDVPLSPVRVHPLRYSGSSVGQKIQMIKMYLRQVGGPREGNGRKRGLVLSLLDDIAWVLNIRGGDIPCNQVTICYAIVTEDDVFLYINSTKLSSARQHLDDNSVQTRPYESFVEDLRTLSVDMELVMDPTSVSYAVYSGIGQPNRICDTSPIALWKSCKNSDEIEGMEQCHRRDGMALVHCLFEMERLANSRDLSETFSECDADNLVTKLRRMYSPDTFVDRSFPTIAGVGANGAIVHYSAKKDSCKVLRQACSQDGMILLDSGAQYVDGTTDVTRTVHVGTPTARQIEMYTRVLMCHIDLASLMFPTGTTGCQLDAIARRHLWLVGVDCMHGIGHGVGAALGVHEGPQRISKVLGNTQALLPNMVVSIEPGYYERDSFGIRLENLYVISPAVFPHHAAGSIGDEKGQFLCFRPLTMVPFQKSLIDKSLLEKHHITWLNDYHETVLRLIDNTNIPFEMKGRDEMIDSLIKSCSNL